MVFKKFKNKNKKNKPSVSQTPEGPIRVKLPKPPEVLGIIEQRVGGSRMIVKCVDGVSRNCKVPGRLRRKLWLREGDIVIVEPWDFDNTKGNVLFKYFPNQVQWLKQRGYLDKIKDEF